MEFTDEAIEELIAIWQTEFGVVLTPDAARLRARQLRELFWHLTQPGLPTAAEDQSPSTP